MTGPATRSADRDSADRPSPPRSRRSRLATAAVAVALALGGLSFVLYLRTLAPGLLAGDSGELQVIAHLLGHTHQTGYPVYILLAKVVTWLPVGEIAYRVNLYSAIAGALAVVATFCAGLELGGRRRPSPPRRWRCRRRSGRRR